MSFKSPSSIGTSSPLVTRYKTKIAKEKTEAFLSQGSGGSRTDDEIKSTPVGAHTTSDQQLQVSQFEQTLHGLRARMREDHAVTVRWLLQDAKDVIKANPPRFMQKTSPFASLGSLERAPGEIVPPGHVVTRMENYVCNLPVAVFWKLTVVDSG